ncbi:hypothetical protein EIQ18_00770 [Xanthomonas campestris pv. campestris]
MSRKMSIRRATEDLPMIGRTTKNSLDLEATIGRYFARAIPEGTFTEVDGGLPADCHELCRLFRMRPVALHYGGSDKTLQFEAMVINDRLDKRIFLTNHAKEPLRAVIGHELTHRMQIERPDLYRELVTAIAAAGVDQERWGAYVHLMRAKSGREGRELSIEELRSEAVADMVGDLLLDRRLWDALSAPSLAQRVVGWVQGAWRRLTAQAAAQAPLGGAPLAKDRRAAITAATVVLQRWAHDVTNDPVRRAGLHAVGASCRRAGLRHEADPAAEVIRFTNVAGDPVAPDQLPVEVAEAVAALNQTTGELWRAVDSVEMRP